MAVTDRREYMREYQRKWIAARRKKWLDANGPCLWCGSGVDLEIDHIDPSTKIHHAVWSWSEPRRLAELAKCRVLCCSCHLKRTIAQFKKPLVHGTRNGYESHGCKCRECTGFVVRISRIRKVMWKHGFSIKLDCH